MRLDKWLKVARVIKRRTIANEVCDNGRISINGRVAKASAEVQEGDRLVVQFGSRKLALIVLSVPAGAIAASQAASLYRIEEQSPDLDLAQL
ncbi:MAG: RNA-binding S4 domain-containing protein [Candidatus Sericytochromatia bacterium]|nr:RNA-binding S4 domain-containing protein [Candidatus Tanganyikabacteria bacterium]